MYWILFIGTLVASQLVSWNFKRKFTKYLNTQLSSGLTGAQVAERMLHDNGIFDVKIISTEGQLTDHYNPADKTVNLSDEVYHQRSIASAAIAAHECGHAIQHATAYTWLTMRSKLVPVVSIASNYVQWVLLGGMLTLNVFPQLMLIGIVMFALTTLFSVVTLPVEYDASNRALAWLNTAGITQGQEHKDAKSALNAAANTYLVAAISSLATLLYYVMRYMGSRD